MRPLRSSLQVLSDAEVEAIHAAAARILEQIGVRMPHRRCMDACAACGAEADAESAIVRIPKPALQAALDAVRAAAERDAPETEPRRLEGWISSQVYLADYRSGTRRPGVTDDIRKGIALVQQLRNIPTANAVVVPSDAPAALSDIVAFRLVYAYSKKPGGTFVLSPFSAQHILDMADVMGREVRFLLDTVSPLRFQGTNLEIAAMFARRGQPITISSMVMAGGTGPVTLAGTLALETAETLATLFLVFALTQSVPRFTAIPHSLDMRTMLCSFGSPNQALLAVAVAQMARRYGLVPECNCGLTDSLRPDFQAGFEKGSSTLMAALAGVRGIGAQGIAGSDQGFSFEQLVIDNEWLDACNYMLEGFSADDEAIAEEVIRSAGIGGSFLAQEHTALNMRSSYWHSKLFNREAWDGWRARGAKDMLARAAEFVDAVTAGHAMQEPVCTPAQLAELDRIAAEAQKSSRESVPGDR